MPNKKIKKFAIVLTSILLSSMTFPQATILSDAQNAKAAAQESLDKVNEEIKALETERSKIEEEIDSLDSELVQLLVDVDILRDDIEKKKEEIIASEEKFGKAKEEEQKQLDAMKVRIQYLYENGDENLVTALLTSNDFAEVLNRTEYASNVYDYDRKQLEVYENARKVVEDVMNQLLEEQRELEEIQNSYMEQRKELNLLLEEKQKVSSDYKSQLEKAQSLASEYKSTIIKQNAIINQQMAIQNGYSGSSYTATGSGTGVDVANYALQFVGNPYVYGGTSLTNGTDCSGFTQSIYKHFGVSLTRTANSQRTAGYGVSSPQPGDIICYSGHVAIYIGDGKIVHASNPRDGIKITKPWNYTTVYAIRRIF